MQKLTKKLLDSAKAQNKETVLWDDILAGFGVRVKLSGVKSFCVQYRNAQGRSRRLTIGRYGRLTLAQARAKARQILAEVDQGVDPLEEKRKGRRAPTVKELADRYMSEHAEVKKKPSSVTKDRTLITRLIKPNLGNMKVEAVKTSDIAQLHHSLRTTPTQANRVLALISKMFSLAEKWGLRPQGTNPSKYVERYREIERQRYLTPDELARLGKVLTEMESESLEHPSVFTAIKLLLFTGCRRGEILTLRWEHVDFDRKCLVLPDSKTGYKRVPLNDLALEVLSETTRQAGSPYVCPGREPMKPLVGLPRAWYRVRDKAGLKDCRIHDLRHSFASVAAGAGLSLPVIGALLGHSQAATTQRYAHLAQDPLREASNTTGAKIWEAMSSSPRRKVIPIEPKGPTSQEGDT